MLPSNVVNTTNLGLTGVRRSSGGQFASVSPVRSFSPTNTLGYRRSGGGSRLGSGHGGGGHSNGIGPALAGAIGGHHGPSGHHGGHHSLGHHGHHDHHGFHIGHHGPSFGFHYGHYDYYHPHYYDYGYYDYGYAPSFFPSYGFALGGYSSYPIEHRVIEERIIEVPVAQPDVVVEVDQEVVGPPGEVLDPVVIEESPMRPEEAPLIEPVGPLSQQGPAEAMPPASSPSTNPTTEPGADPADPAEPVVPPAPVEPLVETGPPPTGLLAEGWQAFERGAYEEARRLFVRAVLEDTKSGSAKLAYGIGHYALGDYRVAAMAIRRGVTVWPESLEGGINLLIHYRVADDFDLHLDRITKHLQARPGDADAWLVRGYVELFGGKQEMARGSLSKAVELSPEDPIAQLLLDTSVRKVSSGATPKAEVSTSVGTRLPAPESW